MDAAQASPLIAPIAGLPLAGACLNAVFGGRLSRRLIAWVGCGSVAAAFVCALRAWAALQAAPAPALQQVLYTWLPLGGRGVDLGLSFDPLAAVLTLVITGVGTLIHLYSAGYMADDPALGRYFAQLNLFVAAMLLLVLGDSLPLMFVGWEGVGLCSYLLIGFWFTDPAKAAAGTKAFVVNRIGDCGMLVAMMLLWRHAGSLAFGPIAAAAGAGQLGAGVATATCLCLLLAATGKSAQLPLLTWLPDAMAGPTPVSALIHAATMVTAGLYLLARLHFLFDLAPLALAAVAVVGACTALLAASVACAQNDIKKVLAYSTVSQLGFMFIAAGCGAHAAALLHVVTHAFFKACLFLGAGAVIHALDGEQDLRRMGGLHRAMPITCATCVVAALAISGVPPLSGFVSKDAILWHAFSAGAGPHGDVLGPLARPLWAMGLAAAALTAFYIWRLVLLAFFSGPPRGPAGAAAHEVGTPMVLPLVVLATLAAVAGALGWPHVLGGSDVLTRLLAPAVGPLPPLAEDSPLAEVLLMAVSVAVAAAGIGAAWGLYGRGPHPLLGHAAQQPAGRWWLARLHGQWHLDALYDAVITRPLQQVARVVLYDNVERRGVEGGVGAVAWATRSVGFAGQLLHSGNVQRYLAIFALAVAALLFGWLSPPRAAAPGRAAAAPPAAAVVAGAPP